MTHSNADALFKNIEVLMGSTAALENVYPVAPFADNVCDFLDTLSKELRKDPESALYPDIASLAFWCRKGNISKLKEASCDSRLRLGRGRLFHIAPSNVPINFAFSFVFGLLSGCANIVRVPSKDFPQTRIVSNVISKILEDKYPDIAAQNLFVRYPRSDEITRFFSSIADGRIIWGGDDAIESIRRFQIKPRGVEVTFADRTSLAVIDEQAIGILSDAELHKLAKQFYNDTYLMDQNACSSPNLVVWLADCQPDQAVRIRFWRSLLKAAKHYDLSPIKSVDKYTLLCENGIRFGEEMSFDSVHRYGNILYTVCLNTLPKDLDTLRGTCGLFYEFVTPDLSLLASRISEKFQTIVCYGIKQKEIAKWVVDNHLTGIDRIVPIGSALDIGIIWDGYDLIKTLSRIIDYNKKEDGTDHEYGRICSEYR